MENDIVKLVVEIESFGMSSDEFDKETVSSDGLQPKQADLSYVHALNKLHLHEIHVVPCNMKLINISYVQVPNQFDISHKFAPLMRKESYISFPTLVDDCQHPKESLCQQELYIPIRVNEARDTVMSSDSASSEVTYTSISSHGDPLAWAVDFFRLQEPDSPEAAPASPDYVPGPEEP
ncbi:hypothetical protein Tco_0440023 [Tanacetum coccineum]